MIKIANHCHYHKALARELIESITDFECPDDFTLHIDDDSITLCGELQGQKTCFKHAFTEQKIMRRAIQKNQALLKACNNKKQNIKSTVDLTAGWGKDSLILATHGQQVSMLEQNLLIFHCMHYLLAIARHDQAQACYARMRIEHENSLAWLRRHDPGFADCLYLDPMFPAHKSKAKPSKELQILQRLTSNLDIEPLFDMALQRAGKRVVVKRPIHARPLSELKADIVYREKTIRFDVYLTH